MRTIYEILRDWRGCLALYLAFVGLHAGLRFAFSDAIAVDEVVETVFAQDWRLGYDPRQPPLYTWALILVQSVLGPTAEAFHLLKYALLGATLFMLRAAALAMFDDPRAAALGAFAILFTYQVGWNVHDGVTHTLCLMAAIAATLWLLTRKIEGGGWMTCIGLGLAIGAGMLSKYGYPAALVALLVGAVAWSRGRAALKDPRLIATLVVALAVAGPYYGLWLPEHAAAAYTVNGGAAEIATLTRIGSALLSAVYAPLAFLSPLLIVAFILAPRALLRPSGAADGYERMLGAATLVALGILVLGAVFGGVVAYAERWMHAFVLFTPLWLALRWRRAEPAPRRLVLAGWAFAGFVAIALVGRAAPYLIGPPACSNCRYSWPYEDQLIPALAAAGAEAGTIVAYDEHLAGNLRQAFPEARIISRHKPFFIPDGAAGPCIAVWNVALRGARPPLEQDLGVRGFAPPVTITAPMRMPLGWRDARTVRWAFTASPAACVPGAS